MKKIVVCVSVLLLCCGMNSAIGQTQFIENEGCQDDLSMTTPKFKEVSSPLDTLKKYILTPKASATPRINGAKIFGVRPNSQFLYTIPATGERPMTFSVENLPKGLKVDAKTGQIRGSIKKAGEYVVTFVAKNNLGEAKRPFRIVVGDKIALTPPMGWNSWNCWGNAVSQEKVLSSARAMVEKGLINHGWQYINIDDGWQGLRGGKHQAVMTNSKFPDMKALADEIHGMGLKIGIYSGPWVGTYAGHLGSYSDKADGTYDWVEKYANEYYRYVDPSKKTKHGINYHHGKYSFVKNDVQQWMDWGIDYLKYDWNPNDYYHVKEMHDALRSYNRDVVYSLSNSAPYGDAPQWEKMANCWRTTGDIKDTWERMCSLGFGQTKWAPYNGPGHWVDPDMLVVGMVGWGPKLHYTRLTPDEQYTHMSLWALLASPLLIGCDMAQLDDFTLSLLTNDEMIEVNQDPLGKPGMIVSQQGDVVVYAKPLEDGSMAVGLFNRGDTMAQGKLTWKSVGIRGEQTVRDLWRQQDVAKSNEEFVTEIAPHGVRFIKIYPGNSREQATSGR
ncbi:putative Ig domain-containing protein [Bacteroides stercorirosoris]|jgi:alpha-galactosidase|uniref:putative Ig domain-containing protein n=1 Tax=Bacteroides stercorirosoris TaxID=871324 RepID=UPI000AEB97EA|nr:putative Ig domain-containing protein [Bacteroides stercorirosoris]